MVVIVRIEAGVRSALGLAGGAAGVGHPTDVIGRKIGRHQGFGGYLAASAIRSTPTPSSSGGTGPSVSTWRSEGTFANNPSARSTNIGLGSITMEVASASFST